MIQSVENLSASSNSLLTFMSSNVNNDYEMMLNATEQYKKDAEFVDNLVTDFSATSEELAASMQNMVKAINEITASANEGAEGTSNIAHDTSIIVGMANEVSKQANMSKLSADKLNEMVANFKV